MTKINNHTNQPAEPQLGVIAGTVPSYTVEGAMKRLGGCSRSHIYDLVSKGVLRKGKIGGRTLIRGVDELIEAAFEEGAEA
ncbi:hypothetical protein A3731_24660 [Roseovarius sp. HI0049]|nr:hypothetical protein A3731_24660 [Roseovarius sp. HI0049]